ncbi:DUF6249 domain-containing protein [Porticoccus sp. GXU_MW_L64]
MKILIASLLALAVCTPTAWAEQEQTPVEEQVETALPEQDREKSSKDDKIDRLFERISKKIDEENSNLSDEEKEELREGLYDAREALKELEEINIKVGGSDNGPSIPEMFLGLTAIVLIFGGPIIIVAIALYSSFKKRRLTHETIGNYVAAGKDIPAEVLQGLHKQENPKSNLHKGMVMVGIALGLMALGLVTGKNPPIAISMIPLFIGLAQLLVWKLESKKSDGLEQ